MRQLPFALQEGEEPRHHPRPSPTKYSIKAIAWGGGGGVIIYTQELLAVLLGICKVLDSSILINVAYKLSRTVFLNEYMPFHTPPSRNVCNLKARTY